MAFQKGFFLKMMPVLLLTGFSFFPKNNLAAQTPATTWTCPMHPEIHATKPGSCPKCGMDLIKEKPKKAKPKPKPKPAEPTKPTNETPPPAAESRPAHEHHEPAAAPKDSTTTQVLEKTEPAPEPPKPEPPTVALPEIEKPRTVRYDLYIRDTLVNFTGKTRRAIAVNGQIPMPTLTFTEGDTALIYVHNELDETTSLH